MGCELDLGLLEEGQKLKLPVQVSLPRERGQSEPGRG